MFFEDFPYCSIGIICDERKYQIISYKYFACWLHVCTMVVYDILMIHKGNVFVVSAAYLIIKFINPDSQIPKL